MKSIFLILILSFSSAVFARGWTAIAPVDRIEIIRSQGFEVRGAFGNPSSCDKQDRVFVSISHPQYEQLLSVSLAAYMGGKKLRIYSHQCITYGWNGGSHNELTGSGAMYIVN